MSRSIIRETAPAAITRDIYLGADGKPDADKSATPRSASGVQHGGGIGAGAGEVWLQTEFH
jgi:hypothetical protein